MKVLQFFGLWIVFLVAIVVVLSGILWIGNTFGPGPNERTVYDLPRYDGNGNPIRFED